MAIPFQSFDSKLDLNKNSFGSNSFPETHHQPDAPRMQDEQEQSVVSDFYGVFNQASLSKSKMESESQLNDEDHALIPDCQELPGYLTQGRNEDQSDDQIRIKLKPQEVKSEKIGKNNGSNSKSRLSDKAMNQGLSQESLITELGNPTGHFQKVGPEEGSKPQKKTKKGTPSSIIDPKRIESNKLEEESCTFSDQSVQTIRNSNNDRLSSITYQQVMTSKGPISSLVNDFEQLLEVKSREKATICVNQILKEFDNLALSSHPNPNLPPGTRENWSIALDQNNFDNRFPHLKDSLQKFLSTIIESDTLKDDENREERESWREKLREMKLVEIIGRGAHGIVIKTRNSDGEVYALKIFNNNQKEVLLNEVTLSPSTAVQVFTVERHGFNGILMKAGIGTLADFKHFLKEKRLKLTDEQLVLLCNELLDQYLYLLRRDICHRDIKPANIILTFELGVKLIDFSLALYLDPHAKVFQGIVGTPGYIAPYIFGKRDHGTTRTDLILGDLFSIGITILEMAIPDYIPKQNDIDGVKNTLSKLKPSPKLLKWLNFLLFPSTEEEQSLSSVKRFLLAEWKFSLEKILSLKDYHQLFKDYLVSNQQSKGRVISNRSGIFPETQGLFREVDHSIDPKVDANEHLLLATFSFFNRETKIENYQKAASYYTQSNDASKALICYENIAKLAYNSDNKLDFAKICTKISQDLENDKSIICHPLLLSTLGIHFYLQNNIEQARDNFLRGLELCKNSQDSKTKLILLVNYIFILLDLKSSQIQPQDQYQEDYNQAVDQIQELPYIEQATVEILDSKYLKESLIDKTRNLLGSYLASILREPELILSIFGNVSIREQICKLTPKRPFQTAFYYLCLDKAIKWKSKLETEEQKKILPRLKEFVSSVLYNLSYYSRVSIYEYGQATSLLIILFSFFKMLKEMKDEHFTRQELAGTRDEIERFDKQKKELFSLLKKGDPEKIYKELSKFQLFYVMFEIFLSHNSEDSEKLKKENLECLRKQRKETDGLFWQLSVLLDLAPSIKLEGIHFTKEHLDYLTKLSAEFQTSLDPASHILISNLKQYKVSAVYKAVSKDLNSDRETLWTIYKLSLRLNINNMSGFSVNINSITGLKYLRSLEMNFEISNNAKSRASRAEYYLMGWQGVTFKDEDIQNLTNSLRELTSIKKIVFSFERTVFMTDKQMKDLTETLSALPSIEKVTICYTENSVTPTQINILNEAFKKMTQLKRVFLQFDRCLNITRESILEIASTISELPSLQEVVLKCVSCKVFPEEENKIKSLFENLSLTKSADIRIGFRP